MLPGRLPAYHDIRDPEAFCWKVIRRSGFQLTREEREDLFSILLETCWDLSRRYESGPLSFSTWAGTKLEGRAIDWYRQHKQRTRWVFKDRVYERPATVFVSFDGGGLGGTELGRETDGADVCPSDFVRHVKRGASGATRHNGRRGEAKDGRSKNGDRRAA